MSTHKYKKRVEELPIETVIAIIAALGGGTFISTIVSSWHQSRRFKRQKTLSDKDDRQMDNNFLLESLKVAIETANKQRNDALEQMEKMQSRIVNLEFEIMGLKLMLGHDPFPRWIISTEGKYLFVNNAFERGFLAPKGMNERDIIGKTHSDIWEKNIAEIFKNLDKKAKKNSKGIARSDININVGDFTTVTVYKMPLRINDVIVGYIGYALDASESE